MRKSIFQTPEWAAFKEGQGFKVHRQNEIFVFERALPTSFAFLTGGRTFFYLPEISQQDFDGLNLKELENLAKERRAVFIKYEFWEKQDARLAAELKKRELAPSFEQIQPKWRQWLSIAASEEEILRQMKSKGRYNIRLAQRHGVTVASCQSSGKELEVFYRLYWETVQREKITGRSLAYFKDMVDILGASDLILIFLASFGGQPLAGALVGFYRGVASYLYGGSSRNHKEAMAPYLLHFEVMRVAKERGCEIYDLLAIAPPDQLGHPYEGLTRFKEQFGGETIELLGGYDKILKPAAFALYKRLENLRRKSVY